MTTDVGQHQMWAANRLRFDHPRRWITSGGLGTMGFGLPAALGAQVARPDGTVVCVTGEGSILLNVQELATAAHERLPVKIVVLDNGVARHGPPAAGHVLGRPAQRGRPRRHARLARARRAFGIAVRDVEPAPGSGSATPPRSRSPARRCCGCGIEQDADCLPMFRPGGLRGR